MGGAPAALVDAAIALVSPFDGSVKNSGREVDFHRVVYLLGTREMVGREGG